MNKERKAQRDPSSEFSGIYEEMYSNWRNKIEEAVINGDVYSSFMNMCCFPYMLLDISSEINMSEYNIMEEHSSNKLTDNIRIHDKYLKEYEEM